MILCFYGLVNKLGTSMNVSPWRSLKFSELKSNIYSKWHKWGSNASFFLVGGGILITFKKCVKKPIVVIDASRRRVMKFPASPG